MRRGGMRAVLERAYHRLGPRYPRFAVLAVRQLALVNVVLGVVGLSLFVDTSPGEFWRVLIVGIVGMALYNVLYARVALRLLAPVRSWLEGSRDRASTLAAWKTSASFPREMMRRDWASPLQGSL